jgi:EF hand domain-containing protein
MKVKTLIACAVTASALPLASAFAQNAQPSGPQGTQIYGNRQAVVMTFEQLDVNHDGVISREEYRIAEQRAPMVGPYQGFSADTNPPTPPQ